MFALIISLKVTEMIGAGHCVYDKFKLLDAHTCIRAMGIESLISCKLLFSTGFYCCKGSNKLDAPLESCRVSKD